MKIKAVVGILMGAACLAAPSWAHKGHKGEEAMKKAAAAAAALTSAAATAGKELAEGARAAGEVDLRALFFESLKGHWHNRLVHFPVALGLAGVLFALLSYRDEAFKTSARWTFFLAALSSAAAVWSGNRMEETLEPMSPTLHQLVEIHEAQGYFVLGWLTLCWILTFLPSARKWAWVVYLLAAGAVSLTGNLGGVLAHMDL